jgi:AcrR family transcriptional regulator
LIPHKERLSGEERRKQIMETALDIFADKGFRGTRTKEIAARIGISETLIFLHFPTKEDLYRSVIDEFFGYHPIQPDVEAQINARDDKGFFYNLAIHVIKHLGKDPRIIRLALYRALEEPGFDNKAYLKQRESQGLYDTLCSYIQKRVAEGAFRKIDAQVVGKLFIEALIMHIISKELELMAPPSSLNDEEMVNNLVDVFLLGLKK